MKNRKKLILGRILLVELQRNYKFAVKAKLGGFNTKISLLEANIRENIDFVHSVDDEKAELQQKLARLTHELGISKEDQKSKSLEIVQKIKE